MTDSRALEPVLGRKFHVESEYRVQNQGFRAPERKQTEKPTPQKTQTFIFKFVFNTIVCFCFFYLFMAFLFLFLRGRLFLFFPPGA